MPLVSPAINYPWKPEVQHRLLPPFVQEWNMTGRMLGMQRENMFQERGKIHKEILAQGKAASWWESTFTVLCDFPFCAFKNMPKIWAGLSRILVWTTRVWKVEQCWLYRPLDNLLCRRFQSILHALQEQGWTPLPGETCGWETKCAIHNV